MKKTEQESSVFLVSKRETGGEESFGGGRIEEFDLRVSNRERKIKNCT